MQRTTPTMPVALTIAGSDSGGGAGIQADLKTFAALGVHGTSAITCLTAQNPKEVTGIQGATPDLVHKQIEAVFAELEPSAVKTGMLYTTKTVRVVTTFFSRGKRPPLVVDPVMVSTSGKALMQRGAITLLRQTLLPLATLVTPNLDEAAILVKRPLESVDDLRAAAREIFKTYGCAALVKGGHLKNSREAIDIFYDGQYELLLSAPFVKGVSTHGTGCTYSAAITGYLALGCDLPLAVQLGKNFITQAIAQHQTATRHSVLNSFWEE